MTRRRSPCHRLRRFPCEKNHNAMRRQERISRRSPRVPGFIGCILTQALRNRAFARRLERWLRVYALRPSFETHRETRCSRETAKPLHENQRSQLERRAHHPAPAAHDVGASGWARQPVAPSRDARFAHPTAWRSLIARGQGDGLLPREFSQPDDSRVARRHSPAYCERLQLAQGGARALNPYRGPFDFGRPRRFFLQV